MSRFQVNIFYVASFVCSLLLAGYIWMVYLPLFEYTAEYEPIKNMAYVIIVLLLISAGIQLFLSVRKRRASE